jgi:hypothetical protein
VCSFLFVYNPFISHLIYSVKYKNAKKQKNIKSLISPLLYNSPTVSHKQRTESSRKFTSSSGQQLRRTRTIVRVISQQQPKKNAGTTALIFYIYDYLYVCICIYDSRSNPERSNPESRLFISLYALKLRSR